MMTYTQKLKIYPVVFLIKFLGLIDGLGKFPERLIVTLVVLTIPAASYLLISNTYQKEIIFFQEGIVHSFYYLPQSNNSQILGSKSIREYPFKVKEITTPFVTSKAFIIANKNKVLLSSNESTRLAPASTTKLMTALVALDLYSKNEELETPNFCTTVEGSKLGLSEGTKVTVEKLLEALLISSSADAACVLATSRTPYNEFIELMNQKAAELGMSDTNFTNPVGLDGVNNTHYSTAEDLLKLTTAVMDIPLIAENVKKTDTEVDNKKIFNTNKLLWEIPDSVGIKTGTTVEAGEVLIYKYQKGPKEITIIVMGSTDRFADTKSLLNWTLQSFEWEEA